MEKEITGLRKDVDRVQDQLSVADPDTKKAADLVED
jgi:hypothetical protein